MGGFSHARYENLLKMSGSCRGPEGWESSICGGSRKSVCFSICDLWSIDWIIPDDVKGWEGPCPTLGRTPSAMRLLAMKGSLLLLTSFGRQKCVQRYADVGIGSRCGDEGGGDAVCGRIGGIRAR